MCKGFPGMPGTPIFEDANARHLNQPDLYLAKVYGTLDSKCKSRGSGSNRRSDGSSKSAASIQIPEVRTTENHKVNEKKT